MPEPIRTPTRITIVGAAGRMGQALLKASREPNSPCQVVAALVIPDSPAIGTETGVPGVKFTTDLAAGLAACDAVIEFTMASSTAMLAARCAAAGKPLLSGTTGLDAAALAALDAAAVKVGVLHSPNMSLGVAVLAALVERAARALPEHAVTLDEVHHVHKKDTPSGTALRLAEAVVKGHGGGPQPKIRSQRRGEVVGEHTVTFSGPGEHLELAHKASDRRVFAVGALRAAAWLAGRPAGRYLLADMLGIR
jgi:4-hydroxy-tetrahydrodipicolinate reductase